tara:strand:- start:2395 stop:2844 length:450 start_codon:yes stop_codon:yes gene_type:complete
MSDIEAQLKGLSLQTNTPVKKENECLYLCNQCKWNIMLLTMSGGISVLTGYNIYMIQRHHIDKVVTQYLIVNIGIELLTWTNYLHFYITNTNHWRSLAKVFYFVLTGVQSWGVFLIVTTTRKDITEYIGINIILTMWYIYLVVMLHMHS